MDIKQMLAQAGKAKKQDLKNSEAKDTPVKEVTEPLNAGAKEQKFEGRGNLVNSTSKVDAALSEGRDRSAVIRDIRKIKEDVQIRTLVEENPEAYSDESIRALARTIKGHNGNQVEQPISISEKEDGDYLREGKRRILACTMLAEEEGDESYYFQPCRYRFDQESDEIDLIQFNINNTKEAVSLHGTAVFFKKKIDEGMEQKELAQKTGYSTTKISRILKIFTYPDAIQKIIFSGDLSYHGAVTKKAIKEYEADLKKLNDQPDLAQPLDHPEQEPGPVISISVDNDEDFGEFESQGADQVEDVKPAKAAAKPKAKDKPVVKKPEKTKTVVIDEKIAKDLYRLVRYAQYIHGETDDPKAIDQPFDRKKGLELFNDLSGILNAMHAAHLDKETGAR